MCSISTVVISVKNATISPITAFMHTAGIVIGNGVVIESGVTIYSGVCLGRKDITIDEYPIKKSGILLSTGCSVLGRVIIGENTIIGAHSLVLSDYIPGGIHRFTCEEN